MTKLTHTEAKAAVTAAEAAYEAAKAKADKARHEMNLALGKLTAAKREVPLAYARYQKNLTGGARRKAKALAAQWNFEIEPENFGDHTNWWVWPPEGLYAEDSGDDPYEGCRVCTDWHEVLEIAEAYALAAAKR